MVKLKGPIFSQQASGTIAKTLTVSSWKGRAYMKKHAVPTNNQQPTQLGVRVVMSFLAKQWSLLSPTEQLSWDELAAALNVSALNAYVSINQKRFADGAAFTKEYPAAEDSYTTQVIITLITQVSRHLKIEVYNYVPQTGWTGLLYRSSQIGFTAGPSNLVNTFPLTNVAGQEFVEDTPPAAGTWYYRTRGTHETGTIGPPSAYVSKLFTV